FFSLAQHRLIYFFGWPIRWQSSSFNYAPNSAASLFQHLRVGHARALLFKELRDGGQTIVTNGRQGNSHRWLSGFGKLGFNKVSPRVAQFFKGFVAHAFHFWIKTTPVLRRNSDAHTLQGGSYCLPALTAQN